LKCARGPSGTCARQRPFRQACLGRPGPAQARHFKFPVSLACWVPSWLEPTSESSAKDSDGPYIPGRALAAGRCHRLRAAPGRLQ
jgi:hypothetical protein